jgi:parallel beta-helix repeat protein
MKTITKSLVLIVALLLVFFIGMLLGGNYLKKDIPPAPRPNLFQGAGGKIVSIDGFKSGNVIEVKKGESVQEAVLRAKEGDVIRVFPGEYHETVYIDKSHITFQGVIQDGNYPVLEGKGVLNDAFLYSGNFITIENFMIQNYKGNAIMGQSGNNFVIRNNIIKDAGVYGVFPQFGQNGLIEGNIISGIADAAIYVGMCDNIDVRFNEVFESVAGIEIENCRHSLVEYNNVHHNTGGILVFITPGLPIKTCEDVIVRHNFVYDNNHENFGAPGSIVAMIPPGSGIVIMAADDVIVENNMIYGNDNMGIAIVDHKFLGEIQTDPDSEPNPDRIVILDNMMFNNGNDPAEEVKLLMSTKFSSKGPDILAFGGGSGSCIRDKGRYRTFGLDQYAACDLENTIEIVSYMLEEPAPEVDRTLFDLGKLTYYSVCSGCHAYNSRLIGPPIITIQAMYQNNPGGIAKYIVDPIRKREDYPEMPPQQYLNDETRMEVAKYILALEN